MTGIRTYRTRNLLIANENAIHYTIPDLITEWRPLGCWPTNEVGVYQYLSLCVRKPTICMGENKDADQLRGNREADQRLCFRYTDSTFPPLLIPKFSRFWVSSVAVQAGLCWTWSETQIVGFVMHRLISLWWKITAEKRLRQHTMSRDARKPVFGVSD